MLETIPLGRGEINPGPAQWIARGIVEGLGVSNSLILPTRQVNALYMGPGEYRSKDYVRIGGGLSVIYIAVLVLMTYLFYL